MCSTELPKNLLRFDSSSNEADEKLGDDHLSVNKGGFTVKEKSLTIEVSAERRIAGIDRLYWTWRVG